MYTTDREHTGPQVTHPSDCERPPRPRDAPYWVVLAALGASLALPGIASAQTDVASDWRHSLPGSAPATASGCCSPPTRHAPPPEKIADYNSLVQTAAASTTNPSRITAPASDPNVIVILADDLGFGDVAHLNPESRIPTPNLDALAERGMVFVDAHSPSAVCTPTRYGLLTGRYAWRTRLKRSVLDGFGKPLIADDRPTIGTFLSEHGYRTAVVGKWHLGLEFARTASTAFDFGKPVSDGPHTHGFDESFIIPASLDYPPYLYIRNGDIEGLPLEWQQALRFPRYMRAGKRASNFDPSDVLDELVRQAADFIDRQSRESQPFLLYFPLTAPHKPVWPAERFRGRTDLGPYADFVVQVDATVGDILNAVDAAGIRDSTVVFFTSDNGSFMYRRSGASQPDHTDDETIAAYRSRNHTSNYVYRGTKADIWEAGHRVPFLVRWPGQIPPGSVRNETVCLTDVFATLAEIIGEDLPEDAAGDSFSLLPLLRGGNWDRPRVPVVHHSIRGMFAIRDGKWKLVAGNGSGGRERPTGVPFGRPYQLYDLHADPEETNNLSDGHPQVVARLEASLEAIRSHAEQGQPASDVTSLSGLALDGVDLGSFDPGKTTYVASVDSALATTTVTATPKDAFSTIVVADFAGEEAGASRTVSLAEGANPVTVTVTAPDGRATRTYTVWVNRGSPGAAAPRLTPADFTVTVSPSTIAEGDTATLTVALEGGVTFTEDQTIALAVTGSASAADYRLSPEALTLPAGASSVTSELAALDDDEDEEPETVTVAPSLGTVTGGSATVTIRSVSHDATLSALSLSGIDIGAFSDDTTAYTAFVAHEISSTTVTAAVSHARATLEISPGTEASLAVGANEIAITVTAEDGSTTQTYTVTVTRAAQPEASIAEGSSPVTEGTAASFTVTLDAAAAALTVSVSVTESGSVLSGSPPASVTFAQGETSATLRVPTAGDTVVEVDGTVTVTVLSGAGYIVGAASSASVTVENDDAATFTVSADPRAIDEGEASTLTVAISNGVTFAEAQTISLAASGTASPSDYTGLPATLTLAAGASSVTATLAASEDREEEEAETVTVTASHGGSAIGSETVAIDSVSHDATLGGLSLSGIEIGAFSGAVTSYQASVEHAVATTTVMATATHSAATVSIQPGSEVSLAVGANEIAVTVTAEDGTTTQSYTVTVTRAEEPALPVVSVAAVEERVAGPIGEFTVSRTGPTAEPLEVQVLFATSRSPRAQTLTVRFLPGQSRVTRQVQAGDNRLVEEDITVTWTLQEGGGYAVSAEHGSAAVVVEESDVPEFSVSAEPAGIAEGESAVVTVAITNGVRFREAQTIALAVSGTASATDYTGVPETLTLRAYGASATFSTTATLTAAVDQEQEEAETVTVEASHGGSAIGSATVTITSVSHDATLGGLSLSGIEIGAFSGAVTSYQASVDHAVEATTVTATASHPEAAVSIQPGLEVSLAVGANEIAVTVTAEDGETTQTYTVTVTRAEEPALPVVSIAAVEERVVGPIGEFTVSRTGPTAEPLELQVLFATSRTQRVRTLTVRLLAGRSSVTRRVQGGDNKLVEDDITVTWTLQEGEGYTVSAEHGSAAVVLEESDIPEFAVSAEPAGIAEGGSATVTVAITNGVRFAEAQTIALAVSGTASATDYTGVPETLALPAYRTKATTATLTATVDPEQEADETVTITASHGGAAIGSATVTIGAGEARSLTAQFAGLPARHDGETAFAFELRFSEEIRISYKTLRDAAFEVTGGAVIGARRLVRGSNLRWEITVAPASDADVVLALPPTVDCAVSGAVCTAGGKALAGRLEATVKGPGSEASGEGFSLAPENSSPSGIWSDGETVWVADLADARLYAYSREDGARQPEKDIVTEPSPMGLWSDGETLWVARLGGGLRAHRLANGARLPARDLSLVANGAPGGVWSDGQTAWVSEWLGDTVHAYHLEDGRREAGRDVELADGNLMPAGLWSDGETLWVADWRERMFAYRLSDGGREPSLDVAAGAADTDPTGLWSGGGTLLSTSWDASVVRAYRLPALPAQADAPGKGQEGFLRARAASLPPLADPALLAAITAALGKAAGESASAAELAGLETLEARNGEIRDLAGLEGATGLKELNLGFNPVADLRPLAALPALESLNLDGTAPDLPLLASLKGLKRLSLRNTGIDDLQPLASLAGLTELDVGDNRIADLSPLAGLTRLTVLRADRNRIGDLWPLASLAGLEVLELGSNRVRDLQPLAGLTRLRALRLEGNGLTALHPLAGLDGLSDLGLAGNAVGSVGALADLGGLRRLDLRGTAVEDLRPLRALPSLVWLHVGGSRIQDLAPLDNLPGLTVAGREDRDSPDVAGKDDARASRR